MHGISSGLHGTQRMHHQHLREHCLVWSSWARLEALESDMGEPLEVKPGGHGGGLVHSPGPEEALGRVPPVVDNEPDPGRNPFPFWSNAAGASDRMQAPCKLSALALTRRSGRDV